MNNLHSPQSNCSPFTHIYSIHMCYPWDAGISNKFPTGENWILLGRTLEKAMAPLSSTLAWKIPWTEEPGGLQSMGPLRVGHDWATSLSLPCIGEGNGNPLQCSCLENPRDRGACWAAGYGVTQSRTRLKRLSSSSRENSHSLSSEEKITATFSKN